MRGELADGWDRKLPVFDPEKAVATRAASVKVLNPWPPMCLLCWRIGRPVSVQQNHAGRLSSFATGGSGARNIHFGVREHAMGAVLNGMALHGGVIPYGGTFLVFADFVRPPSAWPPHGHPRVYVFTHDSLGVGEDGPTISHRAPGRPALQPPSDRAPAGRRHETAQACAGLFRTRAVRPDPDPAESARPG
jgi:transketolase